ncbi:response regulator [Pedobacter mendelii]|uniref:Response regulatory domain-containing protein n=1 Tax=Pedobacter mendelii TaxID=1908240 RepID=A0ABQ2BD50_9SPHI|nr:response regulator [Pedobacter mendelii]GGI23361.1 hypothetical protein GCM10008119_07260 [Pedobacter mendelii]
MKKKILIIERDQYIQDIVSLILTEAGYIAITSKSDEDILQEILTLMPDGILLDIIKPTKEGTKMCLIIKETENTKDIPVIVLSTHPNSMAIKEICADDVLTKPFDIDELIAILDKQFT